jgi:hypothetical protein
MKDRYPREVRAEIGIEEDGEASRILVCQRGMEIAHYEHEYDLTELQVEEAPGSKQFADFLWIGLLPFRPDLDRDEMKMYLTPKDLVRLRDEVWGKIQARQMPDNIEEIADEVRGDGDTGKGSADDSGS